MNPSEHLESDVPRGAASVGRAGVFIAGLIAGWLLLGCACGRPGTGASGPGFHSDVSERISGLLQRIDTLNGRGQYAPALPLARELLQVVEKEKGPDHQAVGACLNILGGLYVNLNDPERAEPLLRRAAAVNEGSGGPAAPPLATSLGLLAKAHLGRGRYQAALKPARRALQIREQTLGADHTDVATALNILGQIEQNLGAYIRAESLLRRAARIRQRHRDVHGTVITLNNLADLYLKTRNYPLAERSAGIALEMGEAALGAEHYHLAGTLTVLGKVHGAQGRFDRAFECLRRVQKIHRQTVEGIKGFTSERQKMAFLGRIEPELHIFFSLLATRLASNAPAVRAGLDIWLQRKGVVLEVQKQFQLAPLRDDSRALSLFHRLSDARVHLSKLVLQGPDPDDRGSYRLKVEALRAEIERLETALAERSRPYLNDMQTRRANAAALAAALPEGSALVEVADYRAYDFAPPDGAHWRERRYLAFVLPAGAKASVRMVDLGEAAAVDAAVSRLKKHLVAGRAGRAAAREAAADLGSQVFAALEPHLAGAGRIFISPAGQLNLVPFEVFRRPGGRFLIEDYTFNYLAAARDLLATAASREDGGGAAVLMGDPDFDACDGPVPGRGVRFDPLPETRVEVEAICDLLGAEQAVVYTGAEACAEVLHQAPAPRMIHLATHGFFLRDRPLWDAGAAEQSRAPSAARAIWADSPLCRSGIALAGANCVPEAPAGGDAAGIVTGLKILGLRLRGTRMVVLSACDTGLGEVRRGEGVFGLRRAFTQAGAQSLVMSMWTVPDRETRELMVAFYRNLRLEGMDRCLALRRAALEVKAAAASRYGSDNPLYWGAFVFMGTP